MCCPMTTASQSPSRLSAERNRCDDPVRSRSSWKLALTMLPSGTPLHQPVEAGKYTGRTTHRRQRIGVPVGEVSSAAPPSRLPVAHEGMLAVSLRKGVPLSERRQSMGFEGGRTPSPHARSSPEWCTRQGSRTRRRPSCNFFAVAGIATCWYVVTIVHVLGDAVGRRPLIELQAHAVRGGTIVTSGGWSGPQRLVVAAAEQAPTATASAKVILPAPGVATARKSVCSLAANLSNAALPRAAARAHKESPEGARGLTSLAGTSALGAIRSIGRAKTLMSLEIDGTIPGVACRAWRRPSPIISWCRGSPPCAWFASSEPTPGRCRVGRRSTVGSTLLVCANRQRQDIDCISAASTDWSPDRFSCADRPQGPHTRKSRRCERCVRHREEPSLTAHGDTASCRAPGRALQRTDGGDAHRRHQPARPSALARRPVDLLITTPESCTMLTQRGAQHARQHRHRDHRRDSRMGITKRGANLMLSLERLRQSPSGRHNVLV